MGTRNQFPSGSVGSNPTDCGIFNPFILLYVCGSFDSSVGRAVDCSCSMSDIHRSLVQIRLEGVNIFLTFLLHQFLDSLVVRISACHVEGPGSIPGRGECFPVNGPHRCEWEKFWPLGGSNP